mmetsp:Transcript_103776/g.298130  ORF Transcript_103776/g.298130 Transcript_103776/m.298130 type:complete len:201 (+) Transcript_103776:850-1452(+)
MTRSLPASPARPNGSFQANEPISAHQNRIAWQPRRSSQLPAVVEPFREALPTSRPYPNRVQGGHLDGRPGRLCGSQHPSVSPAPPRPGLGRPMGRRKHPAGLGCRCRRVLATAWRRRQPATWLWTDPPRLSQTLKPASVARASTPHRIARGMRPRHHRNAPRWSSPCSRRWAYHPSEQGASLQQVPRPARPTISMAPCQQ